jgi:hypothetical protein
VWTLWPFLSNHELNVLLLVAFYEANPVALPQLVQDPFIQLESLSEDLGVTACVRRLSKEAQSFHSFRRKLKLHPLLRLGCAIAHPFVFRLFGFVHDV